ncbi:MAG TPA: hypothetical protein VG826_31085 [Pirellulales bacterium]|nr:hypothetical protein [Pirellulales bacterium]
MRAAIENGVATNERSEAEIILGELMELHLAGQVGTVHDRLGEICRRHWDGNSYVPTRLVRECPKDASLILVTELEEFGLGHREANTLAQWLVSTARQTGRGEAGMECLQLDYLCRFSADDLLAVPQLGPGAVESLRVALDSAGRSCRPRRLVRLRGDQAWQPNPATLCRRILERHKS